MLAILGTLVTFVLIGIGGLALFAIGLKYSIIAIKKFIEWLMQDH